MLTVFLIDGKTRIILPSSQWGFNVREKLSQTGHSVQATDQDPDLIKRDTLEMENVELLIDGTGL